MIVKEFLRVFLSSVTTPNPANEVTTGFGMQLSVVGPEHRERAPSACEPFREAIELGLSRGRNARGGLAGPGRRDRLHSEGMARSNASRA